MRAAGMHNFLMIGPPGSGKTMIARRIPGICLIYLWKKVWRLQKIQYARIAAGAESLLLTASFPIAPSYDHGGKLWPEAGRVPEPGEVSLSSKGNFVLR